MKVLVSAYACAPERGSEPEVGLRAVLAAASRHETWVITRHKNVASLQSFVRQHAPDCEARVHIVGVDLGRLMRRAKRLGIVGLYIYYEAWQRRTREVARALDEQVDFDVVHHVTFGTYWMRAGVAEIGKPTVWGPVGGAAGPPWPLLAVLGWRGVARNVVRSVAQRTLFRAVAPRPSDRLVALVQNPQTAVAVGASSLVTHAVAVSVEAPAVRAPRRSNNVVFAGRLEPFKAASLAVRTMRYVQDPRAKLIICGEGPERNRLLRNIDRWNLQDRVQLVGRLPREHMLELVSAAGAFLHPCLHEDAGIAVAEALTLRTPVICLDHAGPPVSISMWPDSPAIVIPPMSPARTAQAMAKAVDWFLANKQAPAESASPPAHSFQDILLEAYDAIAPCEKGRATSGSVTHVSRAAADTLDATT